jgi:hypothetical protein
MSTTREVGHAGLPISIVRQAWRVARKRYPTGYGGWLVTWRCKSSTDPGGGNR